MRKTQISVEGLRILRTEGEIVLKNWASIHPAGQEQRRKDLREAIREANTRLEVADSDAPVAPV